MALNSALAKLPSLSETVERHPESENCPHLGTVARFSLIATLMAAPFAFGSVQTWAWASLAVMASVLLLLWAIGAARQQKLTIHWSPLYVPAALFLLLGTIQFIGKLTLDPFGTREALIKLTTDLILFFLAAQLWAGAPARAWKRLGLAVVIYAFALSLFAIVQFFTSHGLLYWKVHSQGYAFGPYVNHNDYAGLMEMLVPIGVCYAMFRCLRDSNQVLLIFGVCGAIASVLLSGSRGGMISVAVEMIILGLIIWRWKEGPASGSVRQWSVAALVGATGTAALILAVTPASGWQRLASIAGLVEKPDVTLENRLAVSRDALVEVRDYPWLGTGLGSFTSVFPQYQTFPTDLGWTHAHNDYVEVLTETGITGGLIILSALLLFAWLAFRGLSDRIKTTRGWIQLGAALGCCGLLVHSFADFNLRIPANAAWFAVCVALSTVPVMVPRTGEAPTLHLNRSRMQRSGRGHENSDRRRIKNATEVVESEK
ncbi:MAG TPA: O-antigen ligase family protein [Terriglobia bacterium]|jgi:O-antigen ligase|nr:O-antigen ligase family protein [Terriglobia bacterium]